MKTLIASATGTGSSEKISTIIKEKLGQADVYNLKTMPKLNLEEYDTVIIGGYIHAGRIAGPVKKFCRKNMEALLKKKLGLFISCMDEGENAE